MFTQFFSGSGTGRFNSTKHLVNEGTPQPTFMGVSGENIGVNVTNGALNIQTTDLSFAAPGLDNTLTRVYQGQGAGWKIGEVPLVRLTGKVLSYVHEDGSISTFTYDEVNQNYICVWPEVGRVTIQEKEGQWHLSIPALGLTEIFDKSGLLDKRISWDGGELTFGYDTPQNRLITITDSTQKVVSLEYQEQTIIVRYQGVEQARYNLDAQHRLEEYVRLLENGDSYHVHFSYAGTTLQLTQLRQSDGTLLDVTYETNRVASIGTPNAQQRLQYGTNVTTITSPEGTSRKWHYDATTKCLQKHETFNKDNVRAYVTEYGYDTRFGFISALLETDGTRTDIQYDANGLREWRTLTLPGTVIPLQTQEWQHNEVGLPLSATTIVDEKISVSYNIYGNNPKQQLRFIIRPTGQVVERRYHQQIPHQCDEQYTYFATYTGEPNLSALELWIQSIPAEHILKETFTYHDNDRISHRELHNIDGKNRSWDYDVDDRGLVTRIEEPPKPNGERPTSMTVFDNVQRATSTTNAAGRTTSAKYYAVTETTPYIIETQYPSGLTDTKILTVSGKVSYETKSANDIVDRTNQITFNNNDQVVTRTDQLGRVTNTLYDNLGRGFGVVDSEGYVTYTYQDHRGRPTCVEKISLPLLESANMRGAWQAGDWQQKLTNLRAGSPNSRTWTLYDALDRPLYEIDSMGLVKKYQYGLSNLPELTICYVNRIPIDELSVNPTVQKIQELVKTNADDIHQRDWYDSDRHIAQLIQKNASEAYLTEWTYHNQGEIIIKRDYEHPITTEDKWKKSLEELRADIKNEYVLTTRYFNHKAELIATISDMGDGQGILHELIRDVRGDDVENIHYYNTVAHTELPQPLSAIRPSLHAEDWKTTKLFDELHRIKNIVYPNGRIETFSYQDTTTPIEHTEIDHRLAGETRPEHARGSQTLINALEEPLATLLPSGVDYDFQHPDDEAIIPWEIYARHFTLDDAGRKAKQKVRLYTDPTRIETHQTIDYYDTRNNVRFHIGAVGEITEYTYDAKSDPITIRRYKKTINEVLNETEIAQLKGGPLTSEIQTLLERVRDPLDRITTYEYDAADHKIAEQHPDGQRILYAYTLFPEPTAIAEEFETNRWCVTLITYTSQGFVTQTRQEDIKGTREALFAYLNQQDASNITVEDKRNVSKAEFNRFGKPVSQRDGNDVLTENVYDKRQRLTLQTAQGKKLHDYVYDAHDRIYAEADSEMGYVMSVYNTQARTQDKLYFASAKSVSSNYTLSTFLPHVSEPTLQETQEVVERSVSEEVPTETATLSVEVITQVDKLDPTLLHKRSLDKNATQDPLSYVIQSTADAFQQTIQERHDQSTRHTDRNAYSETLTETTAVGEQTQHQYGVTGVRIKTIDSAGHIEESVHDAAYRNTGNLYTPPGAQTYDKWSATHTLNAFGDRVESTTAITGMEAPVSAVIKKVKKVDYDASSRAIATIEDPEHLARVTSTPRRLDGAKLQQAIASASKRNDPVREVDYEQDGFGRNIKTITQADDNVQLATLKHFDAGDKPTSITDANSDITHFIYAGHGLSTLTISPDGRGTVIEVNQQGNLLRQRQFVHRFTLSQIAEIRKEAYVTDLTYIVLQDFYVNQEDLLRQNIYDRAGYLRYSVTPGGQVTEYRYNTAGHKIWGCTYAKRVSVDTLNPFTLTSIAAEITPNTAEDAATHYITDAEGRSRYIIDAERFLTAQTYNEFGLVHESIRYAQVIDATEDLFALTFERAQTLALARENNVKNYIDLTYYSAHTNQKGEHLPRFKVNSAGQLSEFQYDVFDNQVRKIDYIKKDDITLLRSMSYAQMYQWCQLHANETGNIAVETQYDTLNRKTAAIDAQGETDIYVPDLIGNVLEHTNKNGHTWKYGYDRAGIQTRQQQPLRSVAQITFDEQRGVLQVTQASKAVATAYVPDGIGRIERTIEAQGQTDERTYTASFVPSQKTQTSLTLHQVSVYDSARDLTPQVAASRTTFEVVNDLITTQAYDAFNREAITTYRDGSKSYIFYDADNNKIFTVDKEGAVKKFEYDAFNREIKRIEYATPIIVDENTYPEYPVPETSENDRVFMTSYDRLGRTFIETLPKVIDVDPSTQDPNLRFFQYTPQKKNVYDAFNNVITQTDVINPLKPNQPKTYNYFNNLNQMTASINALGYLTEYYYDAQGNQIQLGELATPCTVYDENGYVPPGYSPEDRWSAIAFDKAGRSIAEEVSFIRYHEPIRIEGNTHQVPTISNEQIHHRITRTFLDKQGQPTVIARYLVTQEYDFVKLLDIEVSLYSPIGKVFVKLNKPKTVINSSGNESRVVPVVAFAHDSHGRDVAQWQFSRSSDMNKYGLFESLVTDVIKTDPTSPEQTQKIINAAYQLATPEILYELCDPNDRVTLTQHDAANNVITSQEPQGLVKFSSYTAAAQPQEASKTWWRDHAWDEASLKDKNQTPQLIPDSQSTVVRKNFDHSGRQKFMQRWVGNEQYGYVKQIELQTFNTFGERIARGDITGLEEQWQRDALGRVCVSNAEDGIWRRFWYQAQATTPALTITSQNTDISQPVYSDPRRTVNMHPADRRETWVVHDDMGRPLEQRSPVYSLTKAAPNVALRMGKQTGSMAQTFGEYAITWLRPNYGTSARFWMRIYGLNDWRELDVVNTSTHMGVKVWDDEINNWFASDNYEYILSFYHDENDPEPYATGSSGTAPAIEPLPVVTPNMKDSEHLVCYVDPDRSSTLVLAAGNTTDPKTGKLTGLRFFPPYSDTDKVKYLGVSADENMPGQYTSEARALTRDLYRPGRADITREVGPVISPKPPSIQEVTSLNQTDSFVTEVRIEAQLVVQNNFTEELEVALDKDEEGDEYLPCYDPNDIHTNHEERKCEPPIKQDTKVKILDFIHKAFVTLNVTGLPIFPNGRIEANVKLKCTSGRVIEIPLTENAGSQPKSPYIIELETEVYRFPNCHLQDEWDGLPQPTGFVLDYPVAIEEVILNEYTTPDPSTTSESVFPLYRKAPNNQQILICGQEKSVPEKQISKFPQRTLFIPQMALTTKNKNDVPISVSVKNANKTVYYGTEVLTEIVDNPSYKTVNLSTFSPEYLPPNDLAVQPVAPEDIPEQYQRPSNPGANWVDTRPYNSIGQLPQPFDPNDNPIIDEFFTDLWVEQLATSSFTIFIKNFQGLREPYKSALMNGQCKVEVWLANGEHHLAYMGAQYNGMIMYDFCGCARNQFINNIRMSYLANGKWHLIFNGKGDRHDYPYTQYFPHFTLKMVQPTYPIENVQYVQPVVKGTDQKVGEPLLINSPIDSNYIHYYVNLPAAINPFNCDYQPIGPNFIQNYPVQNNAIAIMSYDIQHIIVAESDIRTEYRITSTMHWTRYDQDMWDWWTGDKYRWEGTNKVQIYFPHSNDLHKEPMYFTITYTLNSHYGLENPDAPGHKKTFTTDPVELKNVGNIHIFPLYSPQTSSRNSAAKLISVDRIKIECMIDEQRVTIYDNVPFQHQHLLYLGPMPAKANVKSITFECRALDSGETGLWQRLQPMKINMGDNVDHFSVNVIDSAVPVGNYEYRFWAFDANGVPVNMNKETQNQMGGDGYVSGVFSVTRKEGVVVPKPDLTTEIIQPKEILRWNRWHPEAYYDKRGNEFLFEHDRDGHRVKEIGPEIEVMKAEKDITPKTQEKSTTPSYAALPIQLTGWFKPKLDVTLRTPHISRKGKERLQTAAMVQVNLQGINNLPFEEYQITLAWNSPAGILPQSFIWVPQEKHLKINSKYKGNVREDGYQETRQFGLEFMSDGSGNEILAIPQGDVQWSLHGLIKGKWHTLLSQQKAAHYVHEKTIPGQAEPETKYEAPPTPVRPVAIFKAKTYHRVERLRYKNINGLQQTIPVTTTRNRVHESYYVVQLPTNAQQQTFAAHALVPADKVRSIPEETLETKRPTRFHYYDAVGQYLGEAYPEGGYWARICDGEGVPLIEYSPVARKILTQRNIFSEAVATVDAFDNITTIMVDKNGARIYVQYPMGSSEQFVHNKQGQQLQFVDGNVLSSYTQPRIDGQVGIERNADRVVISRTHQHHTGEIIQEDFADGTSNIYERDFAGKQIKVIDRSEATIITERDLAGGLTQQVSTGGNHGMGEDGKPVPGQSLAFSHYTDGTPYQKLDHNRNVMIETRPEIGGQIERREVFFGGKIIQDYLAAYNAMGWPSKQSDLFFDMDVLYDSEANKRGLYISSKHPETGEGFPAQVLIFTYNAARQVLIARADRDENTHMLIWNANTSSASYERGRRFALDFYRRDKGYRVLQENKYDNNGRLRRVIEGEKTVAGWEYDNGGRIESDLLEDEGFRQYKYKYGSNQMDKVIQKTEGGSSTTTHDGYTPDGMLARVSQEGHQDETDYESILDYSYVYFDRPHQSLINIMMKIDDYEWTPGLGTLFRGSNAELLRYDDKANPKNDKRVVIDMDGTPYITEEGAPDQTIPTRYHRNFPLNENETLGEWIRDPERTDVDPNGGYLWETTMVSALDGTSQHQVSMIGTAGVTLQKMSGGNQELLWAYMHANPGLNASEDLAGKQVKFPYGQAQTGFNANNKGKPHDMNRMLGNTTPSAPLPYLPDPERVGGFKQYLPAIVGVVVSIATFRLAKAAMIAAATYFEVGLAAAGAAAAGTSASALTAPQIISLMALSSTAVAAGNSAAQLTAMELYPDLIPNGFDWTRVGQSALLGAIMGLTHGAGWNIMGVPTSEIKIWGDTLVAMERAATTYLTTYAFNKAAGNSTSSFDMAALAGVMLSAGVMESVLTRYGFTETRSNLDAWNANELPVFMKDTVAVLGGGFADAAFAAAFSGEPMNPEVVFAMSMGRLVGRQIGYGVEAMYPAKTSTAAVNTFGVQGSTYYTQTAEELIAHQSGTHRIQAPNLVPPTTTSSLGYARSVPDSVEDTLPSTQTPRAKALMTPAYHNAIQEEVFAAGNPTYQTSRARTGASHRQVEMWSAMESSDAQLSAMSDELPFYGPQKPANMWDYSAGELGTALIEGGQQGFARWKGYYYDFRSDPMGTLHTFSTSAALGLLELGIHATARPMDGYSAFNHHAFGAPLPTGYSQHQAYWEGMFIDPVMNFVRADGLEQIRMIGNYGPEEALFILGGGITGKAVKTVGTMGKQSSFLMEKDVYHTVPSSNMGHSILTGIDSEFFNSKSRFGRAFYVSELPDTTLAELSHYNKTGTHTIRFSFSNESSQVLDLTNPGVANYWGYRGGEATYSHIGKQAQLLDYDTIIYPSERGIGRNLAIFENFEDTVKHQMIVPTPEIYPYGFKP